MEQRPSNKKQRLLTARSTSQEGDGLCLSPVQRSASSASQTGKSSYEELEKELESTMTELLSHKQELKELKKQLDESKAQLQEQMVESQVQVNRLREELYLPPKDEAVKKSPLVEQMTVQLEHLKQQEWLLRDQLQSTEKSQAETVARLSQEKKEQENLLQTQLDELEAVKQRQGLRIRELELANEQLAKEAGPLEELRRSLELRAAEIERLRRERGTAGSSEEQETLERQVAELLAQKERLIRSQVPLDDDGELFKLRLTNSKLVLALEQQKGQFERGSAQLREQAVRLEAAHEAQRSQVLALRQENDNLQQQLRLLDGQVKQHLRTLQKQDEAGKLLATQSGQQLETIRQYQERVFTEPRLVATLKQRTEQLEKDLQKLDGEKKRLERIQASKKSQGRLETLLTRYEERARCSVCTDRLRNTALTGCGHVFCSQCIQKRIEKRSRKCPECARKFSEHDQLTLYLGDDDE